MLIEVPGHEVTLKGTVLLASVPAVTTTDPVIAAEGTVATILVFTQDAIAAATLLKVTDPFAVPNFVPVIVTIVPVGPLFGVSVLMPGVMVKLTALLATPPTLTVMLPVLAVAGT